MLCAVVPVSEAHATLKKMNSQRVVDNRFKITKHGSAVYVPLKRVDVSGVELREFDPPLRIAGVSPQFLIRENLRKAGIVDVEIPEKWVRYGSSVILRLEGTHQREIAEEYVRVLGVRSVYRYNGRIHGIYREPSVKLILGPGGDIDHVENGIHYIFNPERIMFSPGNVNERVLSSRYSLHGKRVLDMFCGIGYFSLPLAKYSGAKEVVSVDVNPTAIEYLMKAAQENSLAQTIMAVNADSRSFVPEGKFDLVVMGNFISPELIGKGLEMANTGGLVNMHHLVRTDELPFYMESIHEILRNIGPEAGIVESHRVKSYSPNVWHYSTLLIRKS